jgi:hypothetical protein
MGQPSCHPRYLWAASQHLLFQMSRTEVYEVCTPTLDRAWDSCSLLLFSCHGTPPPPAAATKGKPPGSRGSGGSATRTALTWQAGERSEEGFYSRVAGVGECATLVAAAHELAHPPDEDAGKEFGRGKRGRAEDVAYTDMGEQEFKKLCSEGGGRSGARGGGVKLLANGRARERR